MSESQQRLLRAILSAFPGFLMLKSPAGRYEMVNPAFCQFLALAPTEVAGQSDADLFPAAEAEAMRQADAAALQAGLPRQQEQALSGKQGTAFFDMHRAPVFDEAGEAAGLLILANNISVRKEREEALREGEATIAAMREAVDQAQQEAERLRQEVQHFTEEKQQREAAAENWAAEKARLEEALAAARAEADAVVKKSGEAEALRRDCEEKQTQVKALAEQLKAAQEHGAALQEAQQRLVDEVDRQKQALAIREKELIAQLDTAVQEKSAQEEAAKQHAARHEETAASLDAARQELATLRQSHEEAAHLAQRLAELLGQ